MKTNNKPEGIFENGDLWFGESEEDEGRTWFYAYLPGNTTDPDYQTEEIPERFPLFVMTRFDEGTPESVVNKYFSTDPDVIYQVTKNIGDKRFGAECRHERATRGYCPDCLRKVR